MSKCHLIVDVELCENCCNCFLAVKDEYCGNDFPGYSASQPRHGHRWFDVLEKERGGGSLMDVAYLPVTCNQCANAPCVKAAEGNAVTQRADGIVMIDPLKAKGQQHLVESCPYGCIWWNEELQLPQKWSFDAHLLDMGWMEPRPVQSCGTGALSFVRTSDEEMAVRAERESLTVLHPELQTKPRVWYKNIFRYHAAFIAGSVSVTKGALRECAAGAKVFLSAPDGKISESLTDFFGDFKFDGLTAGGGEYALSISVEDGQLSSSEKVKLTQSINLGELHLGEMS